MQRVCSLCGGNGFLFNVDGLGVVCSECKGVGFC
jgi:hypothetical protein